MKNRFFNVVKFLLIAVITLSSFALFGCKKDEVEGRIELWMTGSLGGSITVDLTSENPHQTITIPSTQVYISRSSDSFYIDTIDNKDKMTSHFMRDISKIKNIEEISSLSYRKYSTIGEPIDASKVTDGNYTNSNPLMNFHVSPGTYPEYLYTNHISINTNYASHKIEYKIPKKDFTEYFGKKAEGYLEYSLTINLTEDNTKKDYAIKINNAVRDDTFDMKIKTYTTIGYIESGAPVYVLKKKSEEDSVSVDVVDAETDEVIKSEAGFCYRKITSFYYKSPIISCDKISKSGLYICCMFTYGDTVYKNLHEHFYLLVINDF